MVLCVSWSQGKFVYVYVYGKIRAWIEYVCVGSCMCMYADWANIVEAFLEKRIGTGGCLRLCMCVCVHSYLCWGRSWHAQWAKWIVCGLIYMMCLFSWLLLKIFFFFDLCGFIFPCYLVNYFIIVLCDIHICILFYYLLFYCLYEFMCYLSFTFLLFRVTLLASL